MMAKLFDAFFGCWHSHYSFPMTIRKNSRRSQAASVTGTYVVCLDCGKELPYDWDEMKIMDPAVRDHTPVVASLAAKQAA
ncbi:MAG: hypothetical protein WB421_09830 [Terriglobales bacterium]|jgi:hypothetical protein